MPHGNKCSGTNHILPTKKSGAFGTVACFSTQTYKHMNSGEGGLLVTGDRG